MTTIEQIYALIYALVPLSISFVGFLLPLLTFVPVVILLKKAEKK